MTFESAILGITLVACIVLLGCAFILAINDGSPP